MREIGVGIIGWGFMGRTHTQALRSIPLFYPGIDFTPRLAAVCSGKRANAEEAKRLMGFSFATDDYRELLAREDVDAVSVCTPNAMHEAMVIAALEAGKHVYVDKPLSVNYESARRIADAAKAAKGSAQMALNNRFFPSTLRAKQMIGEGKLGEILSFSFRYLHSGSIDPEKPAGWKQSAEGGVLLDLGSHALDLLIWLLGEPERANCAVRTLYSERPKRGGGRMLDVSEDQALATLALPNGALGTLEASKIATGACDELTFEIRGDKGALSWSLMNPDWLDYYDNTLPDVPLGGLRGFTRIECVGRYPAPGGVFLPSKNTVGWERGHLHSYYSFLDCVAHGRAPSPSVEDGARLQYVMDALLLSARNGQWVSIPKD